MVKVYVTKWGLTKGVLEFEVESVKNDIITIPETVSNVVVKVERKDMNWFTNKDDAILRVEEMRIREVEKLKFKLERLINKKTVDIVRTINFTEKER